MSELVGSQYERRTVQCKQFQLWQFIEHTASFDRTPNILRQSVTAAPLIRVSNGVSVAKLGEWFTSISTGLRSSVIKMSMPKSSKHLRQCKMAYMSPILDEIA